MVSSNTSSPYFGRRARRAQAVRSWTTLPLTTQAGYCGADAASNASILSSDQSCGSDPKVILAFAHPVH